MIDNGRDAIIDIAYFAAAILFILGLKFLSSPARARRGNQIAAIGMAVAILATFLTEGWESQNYILIVIALLIGGGISAWRARVVKMTEMPQMTAVFNGVGGATAALVSLGDFIFAKDVSSGVAASIVAGTVIGCISFAGSIIAFLKLQELISGGRITYPNQKTVNAALAIAILLIGIVITIIDHNTGSKALLWVVFAASLALGLSVVMPIGGADMPVVIAILNSLTGLAAALTGLVLNNEALVVAGALVGASGSYLTILMAKAMNRSVFNVIFGQWGATTASSGASGPSEQLPIRETTAEDLAVQLAYAQKVIVVPGYGLAVAQAQHAVRELADVLQERGVEVSYAIHPVAGRMPGHMNVLLAEANVPYDDLKEMDEINDEFAQTDVALVIGANDVTNPAARDDPSSPIYGMPILNVDQAQNIVVLKRSMKSGFAGIENMLFHDPKTSMLFGDAKVIALEGRRRGESRLARYQRPAIGRCSDREGDRSSFATAVPFVISAGRNMAKLLRIAVGILALATLVVVAVFAIGGSPAVERAEPTATVSSGEGTIGLFVEPDDGREPVLAEIAAAKSTIDLTIYLLTDRDIIAALGAAQTRGVQVRVIMDQYPYGGSGNPEETAATLRQAGIAVKWSSSKFTFTHAKTMVIDASQALIMNLNLSRSAFESNREFGIISTNPGVVMAAQAIFDADWTGARIDDAGPLVVSPINSRDQISGLIESATQSIDIYAEVMRDAKIVALLKTKAADGVRIRLILSPDTDVKANAILGELVDAGVEVRLMSSLYIHAKAIVVDGQRAFVGSENFTATSLDENREIGLITSDPVVVARLTSTFEI